MLQVPDGSSSSTPSPADFRKADADSMRPVETVAGYAYVYAARAQWPPPGQLPGFALIVIGVLIVVRLRAARAHGAQAGLDLVEVQGAHERITDDHGPHAVRGPLLELAGDHAAAPLPCRGGPVHGQRLPRFFDGATHQRSRRLGWRGPCSLAPLA